MIKVILVVVACAAPDYTDCAWMVAIERPNPIQCQKDRIPVSAWWRDEIRRQGFPDWSIFTRCELINPEKNGGLG